MDKAMITEHLQMAERHVAQGQRHIDRQREIISELKRDGHDTSAAVALLAQFEELQALHIQDRDRLKAELTQA